MKKTPLLVGLMLCAAIDAQAQARPGQEPICIIDGARVAPSECATRPQPAEDPIARYLFPPELVMAHQQAVGLTDRQRSAIQDALKEAQGKFVDLQFKMSSDVEKLQELLRGTTVDETRLLEQVDRVLAVEREIKHTQLTLMVRIKNQLSEQQQAALMKLRSPMQPRVF